MNKQAKREYMREWREKNRDKVNEYAKKYRQKHPDRIKAAQEKYWEMKETKEKDLPIEIKTLNVGCNLCGNSVDFRGRFAEGSLIKIICETCHEEVISINHKLH